MEGLSPLFSQMIRLMIMRAMLWIGGESEGAYCLSGRMDHGCAGHSAPSVCSALLCCGGAAVRQRNAISEREKKSGRRERERGRVVEAADMTAALFVITLR